MNTYKQEGVKGERERWGILKVREPSEACTAVQGEAAQKALRNILFLR